ncbi:hypothetical protein [Oceanisphaera ostreae]|uniref:Aconitate hydratase n=1 Tax=Oceanisphaera ostreae TaxID=914151 RepID=A0ABW3KGN6_9GAMM
MSTRANASYTETLTLAQNPYLYYSLQNLSQSKELSRLPKSLKVLIENLLRNLDGDTVSEEDIAVMAAWLQQGESSR